MAEDDPWLQAKLWIFSIGALLALLGMGLENGWLIGAAGIMLAAGLLLRFVKRPGLDSEADRGADPDPD
jgi:hypothetical protein